MILNDSEVARYQEIVAKALGWLRRNRAEIEAQPDVSAHYKAPYLYAATGERFGAARHLRLIVERYLQRDGDFRTGPEDPGWPQEPPGPGNRYVYADSWIVKGLHQMEFYGAARRGLKFLLRFQDPRLGGFRSRFDVASGAVNEQFLDASSTSVAGLALLACGRTDEAARAAEFVARVLDAQPEPEKYYFTSWDAAQGLMTDVFGDDELGALRGRKQFCVSAADDAMREQTWMIGLAMTFLARACNATGEDRLIKGAERLFDFFHRMDEGRWTNLASCKVMWGSSEMYRITGKKEYGETAQRILKGFAQSQYEWGGWVHNLWFKGPEDQPFGATTDIIHELAGEITEAAFNLSGK